MRGTILGYDRTSHTGAISGHDGNRYDFALNEWKSPGLPAKGMLVDFVPSGGLATKIYLVDAPAKNESWLSFLFSSDGRISRKRYWLSYVLPAFVIFFFAAFLDGLTSDRSERAAGVFQGLAWLFLLWPSFAVVAKRLHDRGMSGWWAALANGLIPVVILAVAAYWYYSTRMRVAEGAASASTPPDLTMGLLLGAVCIAFALVWIFFVIQIGFVRGQVGENKYGDDPLPTPADVRSDRTVTAVFGALALLIFLILPVSAYWYYTTRMKKADTPTPEELGLIPEEDGATGGDEANPQPPTDAAAPGDPVESN